MELSKHLLNTAKSAGLCTEHQSSWKDRSVAAFVEYYKANPDWCIERQYPSYDLLSKEFNSEDVRKQGVYVGQDGLDISLTEPEGLPIYIFNQCSGTLIAEGWTAPKVYIALGSKIKIIVKDNAHLFVDCYDDAELEVVNLSKGRVTIYKYGELSPAVSNNYVKIIDKYARSRKTL